MPWSTGDKGEGRPGGEHRGLPVQQHGRGQGAAQGHIIHWSQGNQRLKKNLVTTAKQIILSEKVAEAVDIIDS